MLTLHRWTGLVVGVFIAFSGPTGAVGRLLSGAPVRTLAETPDRPVAIDRALAEAARALPGLQVNWIALPRKASAPLSFWGAEYHLHGCIGHSGRR